MFAPLRNGIRADIDQQILSRRPRITSRPRLQITRPAVLFGTLGQTGYDTLTASSDQALKLATNTLRHSSSSAILGTLVLAAIMGLIAGRRL